MPGNMHPPFVARPRLTRSRFEDLRQQNNEAPGAAWELGWARHCICKSADPGLRQGRGGAWDHRRCGACFCWLATTLPSARRTGHCPLLLRAFKPASSRHSGHCPLLLRAFKPAVCQASNASNARGSFEQALPPLPSVAKGVQACRLPGLKCLKRCAAASSRHSGHCPLLLRAFKPAVCQASNASNARGSFEQALRPLPSVVKGVQACRLPGLKCLKRCAAASSRHSGHCPLLLRAFKPAVCQASNASNAARQLRAGTQATALCC